MNSKPNISVWVQGCSSCPFCSRRQDSEEPECALANLRGKEPPTIPRDPHDVHEVADAVPSNCPLWGGDALVRLRIDRTEPKPVPLSPGDKD